jgi:high-affinity K+ transport system ATPase subunit B
LIGLLDPPRKEAIEAVKECHGGGIRVTMITGDHKITAAAIAKMLGIGDGKTAVAGTEIEEMNEAALLAGQVSITRAVKSLVPNRRFSKFQKVQTRVDPPWMVSRFVATSSFEVTVIALRSARAR